MATQSVSPQRPSWLRPKYFVFTIVALMFAYVLRHNESSLLRPHDPVWEHYRQIQWSLLPHALAAACALLLGPMQFSDRLRQRFTRLHRVAGRIYVFGVFIGAPLGVYTQYMDERLGSTRGFTVATILDATLWITVTGIAFVFATRGMIQQHRQWMTRSFAVAIVFLEVRVITGVTGWDQLPFPVSDRITETVVWSCVAASLLLADIVVYWQDLRRAARQRSSPA
jgi:uncharacterized membrane protein